MDDKKEVSEKFYQTSVETIVKHIRGLEAVGDEAQAIARELRAYHFSIDEYVDAITSAFRSGDLALAALKRKELLYAYGKAQEAVVKANLTPYDILDLLRVEGSE